MLLSGSAAAASVQAEVYLSTAGLGLLVLPREAVAAFAIPAKTPVQTVSGILGAVDGGAESQGWYLRGMMAAPMVVNLGALNLQWVRASGSADEHLLGIRLGVLNTTVPMVCDGVRHVVLQLDSSALSGTAKLSALGAQRDTVAARVEYTCTL